jgi:transcriptional regulator with XRE-family HTH domain
LFKYLGNYRKEESLMSERLRALVLERKWTQRELARRADLGEAEVSRIFSGRQRPYSGQARRLARALKVSVAELFPECEGAAREPVKAARG